MDRSARDGAAASLRIACIDVPALPLQILRRDRPTWAGHPLAVVAEDRPQASVLAVSKSARALGVRPGMRYAAALSIARELRAAPVSPRRIAELRAELVGALLRLSPRVEPDREHASVVWVDPTGMLALFESYERWAQSAHGILESLDLTGAVVVGWQRALTLAVARGTRGVRILESAADERARASRTPLGKLELPLAAHETLHTLGLRTLGELLALPRDEIAVRLGPEVARFVDRHAPVHRTPFEVAPLPDPIEMEADIDPPDDDRARLLFCIKGALHALLSALAARRLGLGTLRIVLALERDVGLVPRPEVAFELTPARAGRDAPPVLELVRLRLEALTLPARVVRIALFAVPSTIEGTQLVLSAGTGARSRDPDALTRGLSRLRAAFGDEAVTRAQLMDAWPPEASFRWEPVRTLSTPAARDAAAEGSAAQATPLVRRVLLEPCPLPADTSGRPRTVPPILRMTGPYRLQSGWWAKTGWGAGIVRDYWYAERGDGALLWIFHDAARSAWFLQGIVD